MTDTVADLRAFNRFYTRRIGLLNERPYGGDFTLTEGRVLFELAHVVSLKPGDRSGLLELIKKLCGTGFEVVLGPLVPNEQAGVLDYVFRGVTQSCCPAVRRGFFIDSGANFTAPPLQARKGESLQRAS